MPQISALVRRKLEETLLVARFTIGISLLETFMVAAKVILFLDCDSGNSRPNLSFFATVYNVASILKFIYFLIVMLLYPKIGKKVKKFMRKCINSSEEMDA